MYEGFTEELVGERKKVNKVNLVIVVS